MSRKIEIERVITKLLLNCPIAKPSFYRTVYFPNCFTKLFTNLPSDETFWLPNCLVSNSPLPNGHLPNRLLVRRPGADERAFST